jgi:glycolate oxidase
MALKDFEYDALGDIVGEENITQDPAILDTYNQCWGHKATFDQKWSARPAAVILPGSTEEVQSIVKVCNRYHIPFKPFSSGFEIVSLTLANERGILLDLRRMDRILEIDVKNMHAVVEPYVGEYRLQRELAKLGFTVGSVGAGPSAGVVAASCCHFGGGISAVSTGGLGRSVLGAEWVLPTGEVLRMGSAEDGKGWFSADGPGPSLRGVMRGRSGANGGHGIITKASVKLYPWHDYGVWEFNEAPSGKPVSAKRIKIPEKYTIHVLAFQDKDSLWEALVRIGRAEIASILMGTLLFPYGEGNDEAWAEIQKLMASDIPAPEPGTSVTAILGAASKEGMEYREKCLMHICNEMGGQKLAIDPIMESQVFAMAMFHFGLVTAAFRGTGDFFVSPTHDATIDMMKTARKPAVEIIKPYIEDGTVFLFPGCEPDLFIIATEHNSVGGHVENVTVYDPWDQESLQAVREIAQKSEDPCGPMGSFGVPHLGGGLQIEFINHVHQKWGPVYDNYDVWLRKIKQMLDPNNLADWSAYIPPIFP